MRLFAFLLPLLFAACASQPPAASSLQPSAGGGGHAAERAAGNAMKMVGRPYHFGGANPYAGFDCSGLVQYSYRQVGYTLPRSTERQRLSGRHIQKAELRRGDLIFFDQEGKKNSHVGIYLGDGRFVHAPSSGKHVRSDRLDSPYWKKHFSEARRVSA
jgi:cell wall-associated NlpC family hydrolase